MANIIRIKRGLKADVSKLTLLPGELGITLDTQELYVGDANGEKQLIKGAAAGVVESAEKLSTARTLSISGAGTGSVSFDGSADATIALTLANSGVTAGSYNKVTVNAKGLVTSAENVVYTIEDISGLKDALDAKAAKTYVDTELGKKVNTSTYNTDMAKKADAATVEAALDKKANASDVTTELNKKANASELNNYYKKTETYSASEIDTKIDAKDSLPTQTNNSGKFLTTNGTVASWADVYTESEIDAKIATINNALDTKATASSVNTLSGTVSGHTTSINTINNTLGTKANSADVYTKTATDNLLAAKANSADVYTMTQANALLAAKADSDDLGDLAAKDKVAEGDLETTLASKINGKADTSTVNSELAKKADKTTVESLESTLTGKINEKATKSTTLAGYGITNAYTKTEVDGMVAGTFHFRGEKTAYNQLPTDAKEGDVWQVGDKEYAWDGDSWVELGFNVDLSAYATTASVSSTYATIATVNTKANSSDVYTKSQVDSAVGAKANSSDLTALTTRVSTAEGEIDTLQTEVAKKANSSTTLSGYGITNAYTKTEVDNKLSGKANTATTLSGYGITDAYTETEVNSMITVVNNNINTKLDANSVIDGGTFGGTNGGNSPTTNQGGSL